ncbi:hypothetical protein BLNAU_23564 [Blattamonas nauphoetae]|uniref:HAT C-terminal dimerisation domain-containing protein n=1 Tax=Blattamonas nauphoetae TaxID=2049346 RepID=A0ABQ9WQZ8_9EUKA|nr:hypothetical protein BLNAU_23564 [Blattamonas nauphoetae]
MGVKIIDLEYATLKSPDGHDRDFVYYHVCGADGKAKKNTKKYRQCLKLNSAGVLCTYAKQIPICEAAKHVCSNTDSNLGTLDSFLQAQKELQEQPRNRRFPGLEDVVVDSRLDLLAGTRQPFTLADSPLLRRHEEILISVGQKNPNAAVSKLVHSFTRQRASTLMKEKAELLEDVVLQKKIDDVVGLCMDSGTVGGITYNAFQFVNPQTYPSPVIADLRDEDHASVTLARSVATIIDKATENGLTIASVVSDSAACMIHCIDLDNIESDSHYTRFVSQPLSWRPFHSQCAAHLLHNAYRDAVGLSPLLRSIHTFVENLVNECRAVRYKSNFSRKPPRFLAHRWISISSLVLWVYQESKKLTELFPDQFTAQRQFEIRTEGRRQAAIHQETHLQQTLIDLGPDIGEYFETGESEDGDSGVEEDYTPAQREMRQKSTLSQAGNKTIKEATIQVLRYELEYTQRFDDTSQDIPIQKVKRRCSSADYSQSDIIGKQSQLERLLEETIGEEHDSDDSADSDEYQTCRTVIGETQWKHLLCVQLGLTIRQSIPGLDPKSILCVQANYLAWLNHQLTLPFDCLFETKPYMYWKNNRDSSNIIVQTLSTVAVCMLSTAATEACCERLFSQMRTLIGSHRFSMDPETVRAILRVGSQACSKLLSIPN